MGQKRPEVLIFLSQIFYTELKEEKNRGGIGITFLINISKSNFPNKLRTSMQDIQNNASKNVEKSSQLSLKSLPTNFLLNPMIF